MKFSPRPRDLVQDFRQCYQMPGLYLLYLKYVPSKYVYKTKNTQKNDFEEHEFQFVQDNVRDIPCKEIQRKYETLPCLGQPTYQMTFDFCRS